MSEKKSHPLDALAGSNPEVVGDESPEEFIRRLREHPEFNVGWGMGQEMNAIMAEKDDGGQPAGAVGMGVGESWLDDTVATTWQPISTAPKDGTRILVYLPDHYTGRKHAIVKWKGFWEEVWDDWPLEPTHWKPLDEPLPAPPEEK